MTTVEVLIAARKQISDPGKWCQGVYFCGDRCCMIGALAKVIGVEKPGMMFRPPYDYILDPLDDVCGGNIPEFNDASDHADVLAAFDRAIATEREKAAQL